jgi:hypothetical protein
VHVIPPSLRSLDLAVESNQVLACVVDVPEFGAGTHGGVGGGNAERDKIGDAGLEMELQLALHVGVDALAGPPGKPKETWRHALQAPNQVLIRPSSTR